MKSFTLFLITVLLFATFGCKDVTDSNTTEKIEEVSISSSELYEYPTGFGGDEDLTQIIKQPGHYEVSEIVRSSTTNGEAIYRYKPENGFTGNDRVELKLGTGSDGASPNTHFEYITIKFTVE